MYAEFVVHDWFGPAPYAKAELMHDPPPPVAIVLIVFIVSIVFIVLITGATYVLYVKLIGVS